MNNVKGITILGSGRSGTSFLANCLSDNRIFAGECTGGTKENLAVRRLNDSYLEQHHQANTRSKLPYGILPTGEIQVDPTYKEQAIRWIDTMNHAVMESAGGSSWWNPGPKYWFFKDPRTTLLHDMWVDHCDIIIGVFRNPVEVVNSYMKLLDVYYPGESKEEGFFNMLEYWKRFNQSLIYTFDHYDKSKWMIDFNGDVNGQLTNLFEELGLPNSTYNYDKSRIQNFSDEIFDDPVVENLYSQLTALKNL
jgi:hypothetical protein|tara:strand:+ start:796 stop:1545 length:750 start_codon:yes stop_codon:yes gene_type:complete